MLHASIAYVISHDRFSGRIKVPLRALEMFFCVIPIERDRPCIADMLQYQIGF